MLDQEVQEINMLWPHFPRLANREFRPTKQGSLFTDQGTISTPFGHIRESPGKRLPKHALDQTGLTK